MAKVRTPRAAWVDAALQAVAANGPDGVRVEAIAEALGVSKGGFYWHFTDRQALLEEMLERWETVMVDEVIAQVESQPADPRAKLSHLFELAAEAREGLAVELALRDWARRDPPVAERIRRVDNRRMDYMRSLFSEVCVDPDEVEARCMLAFSLFIGSNFIAADHGAKTRAQVVRLAAQRLFSESWD